MPHMSNLPWFNIYCLIFAILMMMISSYSFNYTTFLNKKTSFANKKVFKKMKWQW